MTDRTPIEDNGYGVVRRCVGHSCSDRNRCAAHVAPVTYPQAVIWERWYEARQDNRCPHFIPDSEEAA